MLRVHGTSRGFYRLKDAPVALRTNCSLRANASSVPGKTVPFLLKMVRKPMLEKTQPNQMLYYFPVRSEEITYQLPLVILGAWRLGGTSSSTQVCIITESEKS
jgi:hypothetical protein